MKIWFRKEDIWIVITFVVCLVIIASILTFASGCDTGDVINEIIECQLPPGHCQMDDEEFDAMFNALTSESQAAYIEAWGKPQEQRGFVSR